MERRILIGVDASDEAEDALVLGGLLCDSLAATPLVVTVVEMPRSVARALEEEDYLRRASAAVRARAEERLAGREHEFRAFASESPGGVLFEQCEREGAIATVVGSTKRGPLGRVHPGSVAESLLHGASASVAVAARGFRMRDRLTLERIAVAYDGSSEAEHALDEAARLAARLGAPISLLTVAETVPAGFTAAGFGRVPPGYELSARQAKQAILDDGLARVADRVADAGGALLTGDPATELAEASDEFDLIVAGSRGHGPVKRVLLGTVSSRLARAARCPLIVVPRGASRPLAPESATPHAGAGA